MKDVEGERSIVSVGFEPREWTVEAARRKGRTKPCPQPREKAEAGEMGVEETQRPTLLHLFPNYARKSIV